MWPYADGKVRGYSFVPLHKNVPQAALEDARLYELLALVMPFVTGGHENGSWLAESSRAGWR